MSNVFEFWQQSVDVRRCCGERRLVVLSSPAGIVLSVRVQCSRCHAELARFVSVDNVERTYCGTVCRAFFSWPGTRCDLCTRRCCQRLAISCEEDGAINGVKVIGGRYGDKKCIPDDPAEDWILRALPLAENGTTKPVG
ncbi:MAG: hypothetical protein V1902_00435 [Candidatus Falkowbacteria bacterium]